ncbi:MAG: hypothetical protein WC294_05945 [Methanoregula sp.]|jgi:hypothetical protein
MTDRLTNNGKTTMLQTGIRERVIFAAPCYEKKEAFRAVSYGIILFTAERMIITPVPSPRIRPGMRENDGEVLPAKQVIPHRHSRSRDPSQLESPGSRIGDYLDREADEILLEEKDARVIRFEDIGEIIIIRICTGSRSSRWLSILFALYPLEPAGARYSVDYQLTIKTPGLEYALITPFSLPLKQTLVDCLGSRVREIIDDYAPLL